MSRSGREPPAALGSQADGPDGLPGERSSTDAGDQPSVPVTDPSAAASGASGTSGPEGRGEPGSSGPPSGAPHDPSSPIPCVVAGLLRPHLAALWATSPETDVKSAGRPGPRGRRGPGARVRALGQARSARRADPPVARDRRRRTLAERPMSLTARADRTLRPPRCAGRRGGRSRCRGTDAGRTSPGSRRTARDPGPGPRRPRRLCGRRAIGRSPSPRLRGSASRPPGHSDGRRTSVRRPRAGPRAPSATARCGVPARSARRCRRARPATTRPARVGRASG